MTEQFDIEDLARKLHADYQECVAHLAWLRRLYPSNEKLTYQFSVGKMSELENLWKYFDLTDVYGDVDAINFGGRAQI